MTNVSNRGSLRPHYGGRAPPFLLAGLLIGLALIGFCYYNLSSQYSALESQYRELQHRLDGLLEKRDEYKTKNDQLKIKFDEVLKNLEDAEKKLVQCEYDKSVVEKSLRQKDSDLLSVTLLANTTAEDLKACQLSVKETASKLSETKGLLERRTEELKSLRAAKDNAAVQVPHAILTASSPALGAVKPDKVPKKEDVNAGSAQDTTALDPDTNPKVPE